MQLDAVSESCPDSYMMWQLGIPKCLPQPGPRAKIRRVDDASRKYLNSLAGTLAGAKLCLSPWAKPCPAVHSVCKANPDAAGERRLRSASLATRPGKLFKVGLLAASSSSRLDAPLWPF